jgi:hypothetical protein
MQVYCFNPLHDARWPDFVEAHPKASAFHTTEWLRLLERAYDYEPVVYTTSAPGALLINALIFCRINSWLTGRRLVSLPFSDHCEPMVENLAELQRLLEAPLEEQQKGQWKYVELRPVTSAYANGVEKCVEEYEFHRLDLQPRLDDLYQKFDGDSIRRRIQRAQSAGLTIEAGRSPELLEEFYDLHVVTRRRQKLPPHPKFWFQHMLNCLGQMVTIRVARKAGRPIAAILTIENQRTFTYKYGCSDARFHNLGGMPFLFWNMIQSAKAAGHTQLDMGRSRVENHGLVTFKDHWGTSRQKLVYMRYPPHKDITDGHTYPLRIAKMVFGSCPNRILRAIGCLLYPHIG